MAFVAPKEFWNLSRGEQSRLINEANKPLTPAEIEQRDDGTAITLHNLQLREIASQIATARVRFCHDAVVAEIGKGNLPAWIGMEGRMEESREYLRREGYHFETYSYDICRMRFYKGDKVLAEMVIK